MPETVNPLKLAGVDPDLAMDAPYIWVSPPDYTTFETGECDDLGPVYEVVAGCHALWAAEIKIMPGLADSSYWSEETARLWEWDWHNFIRALYSLPEETPAVDGVTTFALRFKGKSAYFLAKAFGPSESEACDRARSLWDSIRVLLPAELCLSPATSEADFEKASGFGVLTRQTLEEPQIKIIELLQREEMVRLEGFDPPEEKHVAGGGSAYLFYPFSSQPFGWRPVARTLAARAELALVITIRPGWLYESEAQSLEEFEAAFTFLSHSARLRERVAGQLGRELCSARLARLQFSWLGRVYLYTSGKEDTQIPPWLIQAAGAALTEDRFQNEWGRNRGSEQFPVFSARAGYAVAREWELGQLEQEKALRNLVLLETELWAESLAGPRYERLRYLYDQREASALFCPAGFIQD